MTDFDVIKENLPKINFNAQYNTEEAIRRIIESNKKFFKLESYSRIGYLEIDSLNDEDITVRFSAWFGYSEYDDLNVSIPIKALMGEKEFADYVKEQEELELKIKAEKERKEHEEKEKAKKEAEEREYKQYLKLKEKYESKGE
jgi:hypothetical protein